MNKLDYDKIFIPEACPTSIGGQAVMDGVMMQGKNRIALAMRLPSNELYLKTSPKPRRSSYYKIPLLRGAVALWDSLVLGIKTIMDSADILEKYGNEEYKPSKFERRLNNRWGAKATWNILMSISLIIAVVISIAVFIIFPTWFVNYASKIIDNSVILNLIEGIFRFLLFIGYVYAISFMKEIKNMYQYHGAEHKVIHCFENNLELNTYNASQFPTLHPRCGTSFVMFVLIISLILFGFLGWPVLIWRVLSRIVLIPLIAGISYELLKWAGRSNGKLVRILSYPGLMLQKLTTAEPDEKQLEVAILALKSVLVDKRDPFSEGFVCDDDAVLAGLIGKDDSVTADGLVKEKASSGDLSHREELAPVEKKVAQNKKIKRFTTDFCTVENALSWGKAMLGMIENGRSDAETIMMYATGMSRTELITRNKEVMRDADFHEFEKRLQERLEGKPLQYIVGIQEFMGLPFRVNPDVLIPRQDTEILVEKVISIFRKKGKQSPEILDMCSGSGAIGISLAANIKDAEVTMTDVSVNALRTAWKNAEINDVGNRCKFLNGDLFEAFKEKKQFDAIVSNPPYIESDEIAKLAVEVKKYEPRIALDGGKDGLDYYRKIIQQAPDYLKKDGILAFEIGKDQADDVSMIIDNTKNFGKVFVGKDLAGLDRVIIAKKIS